MFTGKEFRVLNQMACDLYGMAFDELTPEEQDELYYYAEDNGYFDER